MAKKAATPKPKTPKSTVPTVCTCDKAPTPHYHLPEGAIVVWDPQ